MRVFSVLTNIKRYDAVGRVGRRGFELQSRFLQAQDVREDVLVQASDQVKLGGIEEEAGLLKFDGDCHFTRASVNWEMGNLWTEATNQMLALNQQRSKYGFPSADGSERGDVLEVWAWPSGCQSTWWCPPAGTVSFCGSSVHPEEGW